MTPLASSSPVERLFSQPQLVVVLIAGAVWLFKRITRAASAASRAAPRPQEAAPPESGGQAGATGAGSDEEERTRSVRADILRKIAERRSAAAAPQAARLREEPRPPAIARASPPAIRAPADQIAPVLPAQGPFPAAPQGASPIGLPAVAAAAPSAGSLWLEELRSRDTVRRAILVREILGPPIALR